MNEAFLWCEKYRPKTIEECVLPENLKKTFINLRDKGEVINMLLHGSAGTGKTTIAKALCNELGLDYIVINGSESRGIDMVRSQITSFASSVSTNQKIKVVILDEADYTTPEAQAALRNLIETFSRHCRFILTCNFKNKIIEPLHSRVAVIDFVFDKKVLPKLQAQIAKRVFGILAKEGVEFEKKAVLDVITTFSPDNRRILNELQRYANIANKIDVGVLSVVDTSKIRNLVNSMKAGNFKECRQFIAENPDPDSLFSSFYAHMSDLVQSESVPNLVLILGEYQYRAAFAANAEINLAAAIVEMMKGVKFK